MSKKPLIFIFSVLVFLVLAYLMFQAFTNNKPGNGGQLPQYILSPSEETAVKGFVKNFVTLYNTYSPYDTSNISALGDYETVAMQERSLVLISQIQATTSTPPQSAQAQDSTFTYNYDAAGHLTAAMEVLISIQSPPNSSSQPQVETVTLSLVKQSNRWVVDSITATQK